MFANPLYSVLVLAALLGLYIVVRIKHGKPLLEAYKDQGWVAWIIAFRSWIVNAIGGVMIAAPDIVVALLPVDLTPLIGPDWAKMVGAGMLIFNAVNTAFRTKRDGVKA